MGEWVACHGEERCGHCSVGQSRPLFPQQSSWLQENCLRPGLSDLKSLSLCSSLGCFWGYDVFGKKGRAGPEALGLHLVLAPKHLDLEWLYQYTGLVTVG